MESLYKGYCINNKVEYKVYNYHPVKTRYVNNVDIHAFHADLFDHITLFSQIEQHFMSVLAYVLLYMLIYHNIYFVVYITQHNYTNHNKR